MKHGQQTCTKVPAEVIQLAAHRIRWTPSLRRLSRKLVPVTLKEVKVRVTRSRMTLPLRLQSDAEQYELMQASYVAVGKDFHDQEDLIGHGVHQASETGTGS